MTGNVISQEAFDLMVARAQRLAATGETRSEGQRLADSHVRPGVVDLNWATVRLTRWPYKVPEGVTVMNGTIA
jgi:hypothetical protein